MVAKSISDAEVEVFLVQYNVAVSQGCVDVINNPRVCTGQKSAALVAAQALGLTLSQQRGRVRAIRQRRWYGSEQTQADASQRGDIGGPPIPPIAKPPHGYIISRNSGEYGSEGDLVRQWVETRRDAGEEFQVPPGHVVKGESALIDRDNRVLLKWVKTKEGTGDGLLEALRDTFASYEGASPIIAPPDHTEDDLLTIYPLPDLHIGMLAWGAETGDNYDTKIASQLITGTLGHLISQSRPSKRAVILGLGDYFHANDAKAVTPGSGHKLDVDSRWPRVFAAGALLATQIVELAAKKHDEIDVVFLPGNHDPDAAMSLTVALALFYSNNPRVRVFQEPTIAWYLRFGSCLFGATHGHTMKPERMHQMMSEDCSTDWGETVHRHFFRGHIHHEQVHEVGSLRIESFNTPAARDAWNAASGFRSGRSMQAITFHKSCGEIGRHRVNIMAPRVRVRAGSKAA